MKEKSPTGIISQGTIDRAIAWKDKQIASKDAPKVPAKPIVSLAAEGNKPSNNEDAVRIATKLIKPSEGLSLKAYPDPMSPLSLELAKHGQLQNFIDGKLELPPYLRKLSGAPWTIGYGHTEGVKEGDTCTQEEANQWLEAQIRMRMESVLKSAPKLAQASQEALAACISLAYNVGLDAFKNSTVARKIGEGDMLAAADAFRMWNKAGGQVVQGLINRREVERSLFLSVRA